MATAQSKWSEFTDRQLESLYTALDYMAELDDVESQIMADEVWDEQQARKESNDD